MNSINGYFKKLNITQNTKYDNIMIYEIAALIFITVIFFSVKTSIAYAQNFNIVAVGDFGCKSVKENNTLNLLKSLKPELFLALGDLSYKKTGNCFIEELQKNLINNTKVTIGNHDDTETDDGSDELRIYTFKSLLTELTRTILHIIASIMVIYIFCHCIRMVILKRRKKQSFIELTTLNINSL